MSPGVLGIGVLLTIALVVLRAGEDDVGAAGHLRVAMIVNALFWAAMLLMAWGAIRVAQGIAA